jgi:hypothetical protein
MKFCQPHWDQLKAAIKQRGLWDFVARDGNEAISQMKDQLEGKPATIKTFDPLMAAHWMIANNAMSLLKDIGGNPLALMMENSEHPEMECPICHLNAASLEHDRTCTEPNCKKVRGQTFDEWIDKAADGAAQAAAEIKK